MRRRGLKITATVFTIISSILLPLIYLWTIQTYIDINNVVVPTGELGYGRLGYVFLLIVLYFLYFGISAFTIITFIMSLVDIMKSINEEVSLKKPIALLVANSVLLVGVIAFIPVCRIIGGIVWKENGLKF